MNRELEQQQQLVQLLTEESIETNRELERQQQLIQSLIEAVTCEIFLDKKGKSPSDADIRLVKNVHQTFPSVIYDGSQ
ncbi:hypothetical protein K1719_047229 [Acacia pycnantha]|nr:hypothetical protein K1719_047229 [Acacia pycnantha]